MAVHEVDSWNSTQQWRLTSFFADRAAHYAAGGTPDPEGDAVIFDRKLAKDNGRHGEELGDDGCNDWVFRAANRALTSFDDETIRTLTRNITLTTDFLLSAYPEDRDDDAAPAAQQERAAPQAEVMVAVLERPPELV